MYRSSLSLDPGDCGPPIREGTTRIHPSRLHGSHVRVFLAHPGSSSELGSKKGNMRRKAHNRLWTLIFAFLLCVASTVSRPGYLRADVAPGGDPPPTGGPPGPQVGDPDWPDGVARTPKPGPARGLNQPGGQRDIAAARTTWFDVWMMKVRMAFGAGFRTFFRF